jgi:glycosyltransferase involved in cell wall biosynthesis
MRIGMLSWESLYSIQVGGVAPHVSHISENLAGLGHEIHIFSRRGGDFDYYDKINDVHYHRVDVEPIGDIITEMDQMCESIGERFGQAQKEFGHFDLVHGHDWHPVLALNNIKIKYNIPYVFTLHSTEWGRNGNRPGLREISHREWLGGYESSKVIVTTHLMKEEIQKIYSIPDEKICIIPNGLTKQKLSNSLDPGQVKESFGIHPLAPVILFCGRMNYQKGPDLLVEAIPHVLRTRWDAKFVFVGEGEMRSVCEQRAKSLNVEQACRFLGYTPTFLKEKLINACDILCVPSRNEPFGIVVLEGWNAGKPVVATKTVSIINNFQDGILAYVQPDSIAWCINYLFKNPDDILKFGLAGQKRIQTEFSWKKIAQKTDAIYNLVLGKANEGGVNDAKEKR